MLALSYKQLYAAISSYKRLKAINIGAKADSIGAKAAKRAYQIPEIDFDWAQINFADIQYRVKKPPENWFLSELRPKKAYI